MFIAVSECKKPKSFPYSGRITANLSELPLPSKALCSASEVNLPFTRTKSPQWLVSPQDTLEVLVGSSVNFPVAIIPLKSR